MWRCASKSCPITAESSLQAMSVDGSSETPFELIGGREAVNKAVNILYEKLLSDGNCRQFFEQTDMRTLKAHQVPLE